MSWCLALGTVGAQEAPRPVTVVKAAVEPLTHHLELTGSVTARRQSRLSSRTGGLIGKLHVDAGSVVKAGDVLMELDDTLAKLAEERVRAEVEQTEAELAEANRQLEEVRGLAKVGGFSKSEAETRETAVRVQSAASRRIEVQLREQAEIIARHRLVAPFDGVIRQKLAEEGEWVPTGTPVLELVETGSVHFDVHAPQEMFALLSGETVIEVRLDAAADTQFAAKIATLVPVKDPVSRTFLARLKIEEEKAKSLIAPGMSGRAAFHFRNGKEALQVPRDAVVRSADGTVRVWAVRGEGDSTVVASQVVKIGQTLGDKVVVLSGLEAGTSLVLHGNESLRDGQQVQVMSK